jgi:hypothetical protein
MEIQSDVRCVALAIRRANKRLNRIYLLQLPTAQLDLSLFSNTAMLLIVRDGGKRALRASSLFRNELILEESAQSKIKLT